LTASVAATAALAAAEGVVRLAFPHARDHSMPAHLLSVDDDLGWKLRPNQRFTHETRYFRVEYATDAMGFRDTLHTLHPGAPRKRILLYGDSLIFGWGIRDADRFSNLIERDGRGVEILNHAIPAYGLDQMVLAYEADTARADEAMFFLGESTLWRIHSQFIYAKYKPMFVAGAGSLPQLVPVPKVRNRAVSLAYEMLSPFYLPYFLQDEVTRFTMTTGVSENERWFVDDLTPAILRRALAAAARRRERLSVIIANLNQRDRGELRRICGEHGIPYVEIGPELLVNGSTDDASDLIFGHFDKHWNVKANALVAQQLLTSIR